jgi:uncharacterized protein
VTVYFHNNSSGSFIEIMEKVSNYNIEVKYNNNILLYNSLTDALVCFTDEEYSVVKLLWGDLPEFNREYPLLFEALKKAGFVVDESFNELEYIKLQNKLRVFANSDFHLTINPTLDCNLNCWYCSTEYAKAIHDGGMSRNVVKSIIAHIENIISEQKATSLHLDWFGGEPLMYFDEVIVPISECANTLTIKNNVKFTHHATTNATLMDINRIRKMKELRFTSFQIPIDGNEYRHNRIKHFSNKKGTYRIIIDNINLITDIIPNVNVTLRVNYDKQTLKHIQDIIKDISDESKRHIQVDFQRVWQVPCDEGDMKLLKEVKEIFRLNGLNSDFWAYRPRKFYRCYADRFHQYAINYDGKIFKCTAHDYGDDKVTGVLKSDGRVIWNDELLGILFSRSTFENDRCLACKKLPVCMGPCIQKNYNSRIGNKPLPCISEHAQFSLASYIIEDAKKRNLVR